jgi:hypothetical protein
MKHVNQLKFIIFFVVAIAATTSCRKEIQQTPAENDATSVAAEEITLPAATGTLGGRENYAVKLACNTYYGPSVQMGKGHIRSWINIAKCNNKPVAMGVEFFKGSLENLPTNPMDFPANTFILKLHQKAKESTPFDHITVNWEPTGHEPDGIYTVPHFDIHFYKISVDAQMAITGIPGAPPPAGYLPASYVIPGATVPQMGSHWLDPSSPELPPTLAPFTHTFIYGSDNGKVIFLEPMITRSFLLGGTTVTKAIPQPIHFAPVNTNYPQEYKIWKTWGDGRNYVALTDFAWR